MPYWNLDQLEREIHFWCFFVGRLPVAWCNILDYRNRNKILPTPGFPTFRARHRAVAGFLWSYLTFSVGALLCSRAFITNYHHREFADHGASAVRLMDQQLFYRINFKSPSNLVHIRRRGICVLRKVQPCTVKTKMLLLRISVSLCGRATTHERSTSCNNTAGIDQRFRWPNNPTQTST